jgi:hypothetical protein
MLNEYLIQYKLTGDNPTEVRGMLCVGERAIDAYDSLEVKIRNLFGFESSVNYIQLIDIHKI